MENVLLGCEWLDISGRGDGRLPVFQALLPSAPTLAGRLLPNFDNMAIVVNITMVVNNLSLSETILDRRKQCSFGQCGQFIMSAPRILQG